MKQGVHKSVHHQWWPKRLYVTALEITFRNLPIYKVPIDHGAHADLHFYTDPPRKPSVEFMQQRVDEYYALKMREAAKRRAERKGGSRRRR